MLLFDFKTDKVIFRRQVDGANGYCVLPAELFSWKDWTFLLVGYKISKIKKASGVPFIVAAVKKQSVVMTGFTLEGQDVEGCDWIGFMRRTYSGTVVRLDNTSSGTAIYKKITVNKKTVNSANVKKLNSNF